MSGRFVLALDQGTTSSRAIVFGHDGRAVASAQQEFPQIFPNPGEVEHDPEAIWSSQVAVAQEALGRAGLGPADIAAIGITNQRETTVLWDRHTGKPVANATVDVWQARAKSRVTVKTKSAWERYILIRNFSTIAIVISGRRAHSAGPQPVTLFW